MSRSPCLTAAGKQQACRIFDHCDIQESHVPCTRFYCLTWAARDCSVLRSTQKHKIQVAW